MLKDCMTFSDHLARTLITLSEIPVYITDTEVLELSLGGLLCDSRNSRSSNHFLLIKASGQICFVLSSERELLSFRHHSETFFFSFSFFFFFFFFFAWRFKWKYFVPIDHILSETIYLFCFCVLFSNIYPKIKFTAKHWSDLCNLYRKVIFWNFWLRK